MSQSRRASGQVASRRRSVRFVAGGAVFALLLGLGLVAGSGPAVAGPVATGRGATRPRPGTVSTVSDGTSSAAAFTYNLQNAGVGSVRSWDFTATSTPSSAGTIKV